MSLHKIQTRPSYTLNKSKLYAILDHDIRRGTVKNFIKKGVSQLQQISLNQSQNSTELQEHLQYLKKSCGELTRQTINKYQETDKFKNDTTYTLDKLKKIKQSREEFEKKVVLTQKRLDKINQKREVAFLTLKTYEHILQRMKKDNIHLQLHKNQLERQLKDILKKFKYIQAQNYSISQFERFSSHGLKHAQEQLQQQNSCRRSHLDYIQTEANKRLQDQKLLKQRRKQTLEIQQLASEQIQDIDLIKLKKFVRVQLFLREVIKAKIQRLRKFYFPYQNAFLEIKLKTHVQDSSSFKSQFLNFEIQFAEKTKIAERLERQIEQSEHQRTRLKKQLLSLSIQQMELMQQLENKQQTSQIQNLRQLNQKSLAHELIFERINSWIRHQLHKMNIDSHPHASNMGRLFAVITAKISSTNQQRQSQKTAKNTINTQNKKQISSNKQLLNLKSSIATKQNYSESRTFNILQL